jgi:hypothetical protein
VPYEGSSSLYLVGEVRNETQGKVDSVKINAVLRDAAGQIVDETYGSSGIDTLAPGMTSEFLLIFSKPGAWAAYEFTVRWSPATSTAYALQVLNTETSFDTPDTYHVRGIIKNQDTIWHAYVEVHLTMYDSNNRVIGIGNSVTNPPGLDPGQEAPFDVYGFFWKGKPDRSQVARYAIQAIDN